MQVFQSDEVVLGEAGTPAILSPSEAIGGAGIPFWKRQTTCFPHQHCGIHWRMFFSCCIAHPAVMMRRSALRSASCSCRQQSSDGGGQICRSGDHGPYRETSFSSSREPPVSIPVKHVEDYELWLRMLECAPTSRCAFAGCSPEALAASGGGAGGGEVHCAGRASGLGERPCCGAMENLNSVVLLLRKHGRNVSSTHAEVQQANRASAAAAYLNRRLGKAVDPDAALAMCCAELAASAHVALAALETLAALEDSFTHEYGEGSAGETQRAKVALDAVREDARSRTAALAVHVLQKFPQSPLRSKVMSHWLSRYPQDAVGKLRLLT